MVQRSLELFRDGDHNLMIIIFKAKLNQTSLTLLSLIRCLYLKSTSLMINHDCFLQNHLWNFK